MSRSANLFSNRGIGFVQFLDEHEHNGFFKWWLCNVLSIVLMIKKSPEYCMEIGSRFKAIFDQAAIGFAFIESRTGRFRKVNKKFFELIGLRKISRSKPTYMEKTYSDDIQHDLDMMHKLLGGGLNELTIKKYHTREDGSMVFLKLSVSALWGVGDKPDYHLARVEDITLPKSRHEKLHILNEVLTLREGGSNTKVDEPNLN